MEWKDQFADGGDALALQAVGGSHRELQLGQAHVELLLEGRIAAATAGTRGRVDTRTQLAVLHERIEVLAENLGGLDERHRINLQIWFEADDIDGALAELDARYADSEIEQSTRRLDNAAIRTADRMTELVADKHWDEVGALFAENVVSEDRRRGLQRESHDRAIEVANLRTITDQGVVNIVATPLATRGDRLCLNHVTLYSDDGLGADSLVVIGVEDGLIVAMIAFDVAARDHAYVELDAHYLAGEAAPYAPTWSTLASAFDTGMLNTSVT